MLIRLCRCADWLPPLSDALLTVPRQSGRQYAEKHAESTFKPGISKKSYLRTADELLMVIAT